MTDEIEKKMNKVVKLIKAELAGTIRVIPLADSGSYRVEWSKFDNEKHKTFRYTSFVPIALLLDVIDPAYIANRFISEVKKSLNS